MSIFSHLGRSSFRLDGKLQIEITKLSRGDLPDWIACTASLSSLTVAEAKGCHDTGGPAKALARAWDQAMRIDVKVKGKRFTIKRIAIATRWGFASAGPGTALLSVRDPEDEGERIDPEESDALYVGLFRRHVANLIAPLGHGELAALLRQLANSRFARTIQSDLIRARQVLDTATVKEMIGDRHIDGLIGGIVTRAGPLTESSVTTVDQEVLSRLNLRPVFVGIERDLVASAIEGKATAVRERLAYVSPKDDIGRFNRAGGWIIPLGPDQRLVKDV